MFSLELPDNVAEIRNYAFAFCFCLQNVAFPPDTVFGDGTLFDNDDNENKLMDLERMFSCSNARITLELQHQFD